jgi:hypothetical protein
MCFPHSQLELQKEELHYVIRTVNYNKHTANFIYLSIHPPIHIYSSIHSITSLPTSASIISLSLNKPTDLKQKHGNFRHRYTIYRKKN